MDRFVPFFLAFAAIATGAYLFIRPAAAAVQSRDDDSTTPASHGEIWQMRLAGILLMAGGAYVLCAIIMKLPGAEFIGV